MSRNVIEAMNPSRRDLFAECSEGFEALAQAFAPQEIPMSFTPYLSFNGDCAEALALQPKNSS